MIRIGLSASVSGGHSSQGSKFHLSCTSPAWGPDVRMTTASALCSLGGSRRGRGFIIVWHQSRS